MKIPKTAAIGIIIQIETKPIQIKITISSNIRKNKIINTLIKNPKNLEKALLNNISSLFPKSNPFLYTKTIFLHGENNVSKQYLIEKNLYPNHIKFKKTLDNLLGISINCQ
ncbi:MAG: hypothetical protein PHY30_02890 [Candidatus Pacebacteria bacterium]|nr:hypothetical protein [Candidatus Paceibacterota bacterium]